MRPCRRGPDLVCPTGSAVTRPRSRALWASRAQASAAARGYQDVAPWTQWPDRENVMVRPCSVSVTAVHSPRASGADSVTVAGTSLVRPSAQLGTQLSQPTVPRPVAVWLPQLDQRIPVTTSPPSAENWMADGLVPS